MMTVNTSDEKILKDDLLQNVYIESGQIKVYGKLAGLPCIGKTYFVNWKEINEAYERARHQIMMQYGDEVFGKKAQLKGQSSTGTASQTGIGDVIKEAAEMGPLIDCTVSYLIDLPDAKDVKFEAPKKKEVVSEATGSYDAFMKAINEFQKYVQEKSKEDKWLFSHGKNNTIDKLNQTVKKFTREGCPTSKNNIQAWNEFYDVFEKDPWKSDVTGKDPELQQLCNEIMKQWKDLGGEVKAEFGKGSTTVDKDKNQSTKGREMEGWHYEHAYRIDIKTNFNDDWFKRQFKSGLLQAAIRAIKTDARSHSSENLKTKWTNHEYTYDEMLPQEKRKLDKIQWTMTNKVARDFITALLGWSRSKQYCLEGEKPVPKQTQLDIDQGFGKEMAGKALNNRGLFDRIIQKTFAGGQSNNVISVAFQLADPTDGWELVEGEEVKQVDAATPEAGAEAASPTGDASGGSGGGSAEGKPKDGLDALEERISKIEKKMTEDGLWEESGNLKFGTDGVQVESQRYKLVKKVCSNPEKADELVENCIMGFAFK